VVYLLAGTGVFGGVKVVLHQASLMSRRGHQVSVVSTEPAPEWYPLESGFVQVPSFEPRALPEADLTVATFWTTLTWAQQAPTSQAIHFCQGFEGSFPHNPHEHPAIEEAYRLPIPAMVVAPHLAEILDRRFRRPSRLVPQALEPFWRSRWRRKPHRPARILVMSPFEVVLKGVGVALEALRQLRGWGFPLELVRISQWPLPPEETALLKADEVHLGLSPSEVALVMASCDLLLAPSWPQEGFGLPVLEAMACGLPVVASEIPSFRYFASEAARLVPYDRPEAFAQAAREVLSDPRRWREMRRAGLRVAARFREERMVEAVEKAWVWALEGGWREEPERLLTSDEGKEPTEAPESH
jgi:glycosyltransferase involved in cell wall biosynthesis